MWLIGGSWKGRVRLLSHGAESKLNKDHVWSSQSSQTETKRRQVGWVGIVCSSLFLCDLPWLWHSIFSVVLLLQEGTEHLSAGKLVDELSIFCVFLFPFLPMPYELIHVTEVCIRQNRPRVYNEVALVNFLDRSSTTSFPLVTFVFLSFGKPTRLANGAVVYCLSVTLWSVVPSFTR